MYKKLFVVIGLALLCTLAACGGPTPGAASNSAPETTVHMTNASFQQSSLTIHKGQSITLTNDSAAPHVIANGTWKDGTADTSKEAGAPTIDNLAIDGNATQTVGPFNAAGTFQLYCTVHPSMNLTVVVQ